VNKRFKLLRCTTGRVVYKWAYKCPRCKAIMEYDFEKVMWALDEKNGGFCIGCNVCGFNDIIKDIDLLKATQISEEEYSKIAQHRKASNPLS
jgi:hypothetical protein